MENGQVPRILNEKNQLLQTIETLSSLCSDRRFFDIIRLGEDTILNGSNLRNYPLNKNLEWVHQFNPVIMFWRKFGEILGVGEFLRENRERPVPRETSFSFS